MLRYDLVRQVVKWPSFYDARVRIIFRHSCKGFTIVLAGDREERDTRGDALGNQTRGVPAV